MINAVGIFVRVHRSNFTGSHISYSISFCFLSTWVITQVVDCTTECTKSLFYISILCVRVCIYTNAF
jgi:hypothetical protein